MPKASFGKNQGRKTRDGRKLNWWSDLPDQRDYFFSLLQPRLPKLPSSVDLRDRCSPVVDQGKIGSCTGNALAGALEFLEKRELLDRSRDDPQVFEQGTFFRVSRMFIYYNERLLEGTVDSDSGATLRDGIKSLATWGGCREDLWKYTKANLFARPSNKAYGEAGAHKIAAYFRLQSLEDMTQCLAAGFPFVFGFAVYESFDSAEVRRTGIMPLPSSTERVLGGHAVMAVGYDDNADRLMVRNSWGSRWGMEGYFTMPYAFVGNPMAARDFWTVRR